MQTNSFSPKNDVVEGLTSELENIPVIETLGDRIQQMDEMVDIALLRKAMPIKIKGRTSLTNLVDYFGEHYQVLRMLREGQRLGALGESDLQERGFQSFQSTAFSFDKKVTRAPLSHLKTAQALVLILSKANYRSPYTLKSYYSCLGEILLYTKEVTYVGEVGILDGLDMLAALTAAAKEELSKFTGDTSQAIRVRTFAQITGSD